MAYKKIGVAGPVGSGKTALIEAVTREMASSYSIGVITNDIYTKEDAEFLARTALCQETESLVLKLVAALILLSVKCIYELGSSR